MSINLIVYILLLLGANYYSSKKGDRAKRDFIIFCSLVLVLKAALRSVTVGIDTSHYSGYFYESLSRSWAEVFHMLKNETGINDIEAGYKLVEKIFSTFLPNFNLYTFFVQSILYYLPLGVLMYKETKTTRELLFGYVLLNALFSGLPMANARQVYAIGFCIWSYLFIVDKRYLYALLCIAIGYSIHHSSMLFLLMLIAPFIPYWFYKYGVWCAIGLAPVALTNVNRIILYMGQFIGSDKYAGYSDDVYGGAKTYIVLSLGLCLFAALALTKCQESDHKKKLYYAMVALTAIFVPLIYSNGTMMRITMYFQLFFVMLIPKLLEVYFGSGKKTIYTILILILMVMSILNEMPYKFFWEEDQNPYLHWS